MRTPDRLIHELGTSRRGLMAFLAVGVFDGSVLPVPVEPFVLPVMAAHPRRAPLMALMLLAGCLIGCTLFYLLGLLAGEALVEPILAALGLTEGFAAQIDGIRDNAFVTLSVIGFTPIPLQIGTLGAGLTGVDPVTFLTAMLLSRGARYAILAGAAMAIRIGAESYMRQHRTRIVVVSLALIAAAVVGARVAGL